MKRDIQIGDETYSISLTVTPDGQSVSIDDKSQNKVALEKLSGDLYRITIGDESAQLKIVTKGEDVFIEAFDQTFNLTVLNPIEQAQEAASANDLSAKAAMPGVIVEVHVSEGDIVKPEQPIITMESMKLFTVIKAAAQGKVTAINYQEGDSFSKGAVLAEIENLEAENN